MLTDINTDNITDRMQARLAGTVLEDIPMFCTKCGAQMPDDAKFCTSCGQVADTDGSEPVQTTESDTQSQPAAQQPIQSQATAYQTTAYQPTAQYGQPAYTPPPVYMQQPVQTPPPRKKRHIGCWIFLVLFLAIVGTGVYFFAQIAWLPARDLGVRYTQADFDSAMSKIGLTVDFEGKSADEVTALIKANRSERIPLSDYKFVFSDYQERSFELTQEEVTAFLNEVAPPFSWFDSIQVKVLDDGRTAGSYRVRFDKIKQELIADITDQIPSELSRFLPNSFNLYMEGSFEIRENDVVVPEKLDKLAVGSVDMQPVITSIFGDLTDDQRAGVFDYTERIIGKIPDLLIHSLQVNDDGNYEVSAYMPTLVTVSRK